MYHRTLWERACSRRRQVRHLDVECTGLYASKLAPTFDLGSTEDRLINSIPCGSELAREGVSSDSIDVECNGLFASKLAPTFDLDSAEDLMINPLPQGMVMNLRAAYWAPNIAVQ